ncbi:MAG: hlyA 4 [Gemmataceae bacterium]|nr:hlyA 4 [Gemmataceae bacterium]
MADAAPDGTQTVTITATAQITQGSPFGLDPTFGTGGLARTSLSMSIQPPHAATAVQPDGKILAASEYSGTSWQLTRLNPDGSLDTSFGTNGVVVTAFSDPNRNRPVPHTVVIQGDGKILVGGSYGGYSTTQLGLLARYNANGAPDNGFGSSGAQAWRR